MVIKKLCDLCYEAAGDTLRVPLNIKQDKFMVISTSIQLEHIEKSRLGDGASKEDIKYNLGHICKKCLTKKLNNMGL